MEIAVRIAPTGGVASADIWLTYDPEYLEPTGLVDKGDLFGGAMIQNTISTTEVRIALAQGSLADITSESDIVIVYFKALKSSGSSEVGFSRNLVNGQRVTASVGTVSFQPDPAAPEVIEDALALSVPHQSVTEGEVVSVPVRIAPTGGVSSADIWLTYDSEYLEPTGNVTIGDLFEGSMFASSVKSDRTPSEVRVALARASKVSVTANSEVVTFYFKALKGLGSSEIGFSLNLINGQPVTTSAGTVSFQPAPAAPAPEPQIKETRISGTVRYAGNGVNVDGVVLTVNTDKENYQAQTSSEYSGNWSIPGFKLYSGANYTITASKSGDDGKAITGMDAAYVMSYIINNNFLKTQVQQDAADVTGDGRVDAQDLKAILRYTVNQNNTGRTGEWAFSPIPLARSVSQLEDSPGGLDFTAVLIGDVTGNYKGTSYYAVPRLASTASSHNPLSLKVSDIQSNGTFDVTVNLDNDHSGVFAVQLEMAYSTELATFTGISGTKSNPGTFSVASVKSGKLLLSAVSSGSPANEPLLRLSFSRQGDSDDLSSLLSVLTLQLNGEDVASACGTGLATGANTVSLPKAFALEQNTPNPFNPSTTIGYSVPESMGSVNAQLVIYSVRGKKVKTLFSGQREPGNYSVQWDGTDKAGRKVTSGVYFYRMRVGEFVQTRKMVILK